MLDSQCMIKPMDAKSPRLDSALLVSAQACFAEQKAATVMIVKKMLSRR